MSSREFPHCGLIRPGETEACECGWSFRLNAPAHGVLGMGPSARERGERRFQSGYGLTLVAVGLLILLARAALGSKVRGSRWCWRHVAAATVLAAGLPAGAGAEPMAVRIMAMLMSDFEAQPWLAGLSPTRDVAVPGLSQPVRCTQDGVCLAVLGEGPLNAAASVMSLGLAADLDLSHAYFLIAGIAGTDPAMATIGSVAWADWIVDADSVTAVHPADLPDGWEFPRFRRWCSKPPDENAGRAS